jgi:hypothetical protein
MPAKGTKRVRKAHVRHKKVGIGNIKINDPLSKPTKVKAVWKKKKQNRY